MEKKVKGLAKGIIEELIRADMSMQEMQLKEWARLSQHPPKGDNIPEDILKGLPKTNYLYLGETNIQIHLKPRPSKGFLGRLKMAMEVLLSKRLVPESGQFAYDLCRASDKDAVPMTLSVHRNKEGAIKASYKAADDETTLLMEKNL